MLRAAGFTTVLASDGLEALEALRSRQDVDLVLMDVRMPRMNGMEALAHIREDHKLRDLKVIAVTASVMPEFREKTLEMGFDGFLAKPFRVEELLETIGKHLDIQFMADPAADSHDPPADEEAGEASSGVVPTESIQRLRDAMRIKNVTAIKGVARDLSAERDTAALGADIDRLAGAFDFRTLAELLDTLEQNDEAD
jgi:CheY-like chemotaxis protein